MAVTLQPLCRTSFAGSLTRNTDSLLQCCGVSTTHVANDRKGVLANFAIGSDVVGGIDIEDEDIDGDT